MLDTNIILKYNSADADLLQKTRVEAKQALRLVRAKLQKGAYETMGFFYTIESVLPRDFIVLLFEWLRPEIWNRLKPTDVNLADFCGFLRCELKMRLIGMSASELKMHGVKKDDVAKFTKFRKRMTYADVPVFRKNKGVDGVAHPAFSFDPLMDRAIASLNTHWSEMFFV